MALLGDRVQETTTTAGTGTLTLNGAVTGYVTFNSTFTNGNIVWYVIDDGAGNWEIGTGTVGTGTLTRSVFQSSNSNNLVNFAAGAKRVFCTAPYTYLLPDQTGNAGELLTTDGSAPSWSNTISSLNVTGNTTLGDASSDTVTLTGTVQPGVVISGSSSSDALRITQTGAGNALVVEDSANPDSTPFVVDANGLAISGAATSVSTTAGASRFQSLNVLPAYSAINNAVDATGSIFTFGKNRNAAIVAADDILGATRYEGFDGSSYVRGAQILAQVDGTPGTNDMPGRLVFSTTKDGASSPTEAMRIDSGQRVGFQATPTTSTRLYFGGIITGNSNQYAFYSDGQFQSDVTGNAWYFTTVARTAAAAFTVSNISHYVATQSTIGAGSTVSNQYAFRAESSLTGATNNYGFYSNIASGTGRYNFYAAGTASNYFAGSVGIGTSSPSQILDIVASGTGGANINLNNGSAATTLYNIYSTGSFTVGFNNSGSTVNNLPSGVSGFWMQQGYPMIFATSGAERMRLTSAGYLGIGTSSPSTMLSLGSGDVSTPITYGYGTFRATDNAFVRMLSMASGTNTTVIKGGYGSASSSSVAVSITNVSDSPLVSITAGGSVGIGTSSPGDLLTVGGSATRGIASIIGTASGTPLLKLDNTNASGGHNWGIYAGSTAASTFDIVDFSAGGGTTRLTLDGSGNLGIGTTSPANRLTLVTATTGNVTAINWSDGTTDTGYLGIRSGGGVGLWAGGFLAFGSGSGTFTERARIDSSGNLLVGCTDTTQTNVGIRNWINKSSRSGYNALTVSGSETSNTYSTYDVYSTGAAAYRFYVGYGGTVYATSTTISAISDQRLKENIRDLDDGLATILALKPRKFDWKSGKGKNIKNDRGFIAQEFEQVLPDLIDQWKDEPPEGEEPYKSVRPDLIPVLVKAIQELKAELDQLKATIH